MNKTKAIFITFIIQALTVGIFLLGMLLDPLVGVWMAFLYFLLVSTFLIFKYLRTKHKHGDNLRHKRLIKECAKLDTNSEQAY